MSLFARLRSLIFNPTIDVGDAVELALGSDDPRASQHNGKRGVVTDVINTHRDQTLYEVKLTNSDNMVYVEDHKVRKL